MYAWPERLTRVPLTINWVLWGAGELETALRKIGLVSGGIIESYQYLDYRHALQRGFGICSQNALAFASLLEDRYGIRTTVVGLGGHVVTQVELASGKHIADPSVGVALPFGLARAENSPSELDRAYAMTTHPELARFFDRAGNVTPSVSGPKGFRPKLYVIDSIARVAQWIAPAAFIILGILLRKRLRRAAMIQSGARARTSADASQATEVNPSQ